MPSCENVTNPEFELSITSVEGGITRSAWQHEEQVSWHTVGLTVERKNLAIWITFAQ
jgi:hypothetical protein